MHYVNPDIPTTTSVAADPVFRKRCPKFVKNWMGKKVELCEPIVCMQKFSLSPGTILSDTLHRNKQYEVIGVGKEDGWLWIKSVNALARNAYFPLENTNSQIDLTRAGFTWITYVGKESNASKIDDSADVLARMKTIFRQQVSPDVLFEVKEKKIPGHSLILETSCEYFKNLLGGNFKEGDIDTTSLKEPRVVSIQDCDPDDFEMLLEYFYTGSIEIDEDDILSVSELANLYCLDKLKEHCIRRMKEIIKPNLALCYFHELGRKDHFLLPVIAGYLFTRIQPLCIHEKELILELPKETLLRLIQIAPHDLKWEFFQMACIWMYHSEHHPERFKCLVEEILPLLPKADTYLSRYAKCLLPLFHPHEHQAIFNQLLSVQKNQWILAIFGEAYRLNNQLSEAHLKFCEALALDANLAFALSRDAEIYRQSGDLATAKALFQKAFELEFSSPFTLGYHGVALRQDNQINEAIRKIEQAIVAYNNDHEPLDPFIFNQYKEMFTELKGDPTRVFVARVRASTV